MPSDSRIYVGNLPPYVVEREVEDIFWKFGKILDVDLKFRGGKASNPYAFVEFEDPRDAEDAVDDRDNYKFDGYRLRVEFCHGSRSLATPSRRSRSPPRRTNFRVFVSGLPDSGSWQDLKDHMKYAGPIAFADVYKDGTGIVEYLYYEDMKYALRKLDDSKFRSHLGESSYITVDEDKPKPKYSSYSRSRYDSIGGHSSRYSERSRSRSRSRTPSSDRSERGSSCRSSSRSTSVSSASSRSRSRSRSSSRY